MGKTAIIGLGNIGGMLALKLPESKIVSPEDINLYDRHPEKINRLRQCYSGYRVFDNAGNAVDDADNVFLCVQAQNMPDLLKETSKRFSKDTCVYLSSASIKHHTIKKIWPGKAGTFLPPVLCFVNRGVVFVSFNELAAKKDRDYFNTVIGGMCKEILEIDEEDFAVLDNISGLTPAYFSMFCEQLGRTVYSLQKKYSSEMVSAVIRESFCGTGEWIDKTDKTFSSVSSKIGHPGGITYSALSALDEMLPRVLSEMIKRGMESRDREERLIND